jgi:hypothetical protein
MKEMSDHLSPIACRRAPAQHFFQETLPQVWFPAKLVQLFELVGD